MINNKIKEKLLSAGRKFPEDIVVGEVQLDDKTINDIEKELNVKLPPSYKDFLKEFGYVEINGLEIHNFDGGNLVSETKRFQKLGIKHLVVISYDGGETFTCIDISKKTYDEENPIVITDNWQITSFTSGKTKELNVKEIADSFEHFLEKELDEEIKDLEKTSNNTNTG